MPTTQRGLAVSVLGLATAMLSRLRTVALVIGAGLTAFTACSDVSGPSSKLGTPGISLSSSEVEQVIELGTLGGSSRGFAVNANMQAVGTSEIQKKPGSDRHAFLWDPGTMMMEDLTPAAEEFGEAHDINAGGTVVGDVGAGGLLRGFRVTPSGGYELLQNSVFARAVNDLEQVVGAVSTGSGLHVARWDSNGTPDDLGVPTWLPGSGTSYAVAEGINSSGTTIVGSATLLGSGIVLPFRWTEAGGFEELSMPWGGDGWALDVNDDGVAVGYVKDDVGGASRAVMWTPSNQAIDLLSLGGPNNLAYAINNDGVIVGATTLASGEVRAFLWDSAVGTMVDLAGENARARDITDNGLVVGTRLSDGRAVIWVLEGPCDLFESTPSDPTLADPAVQSLLVGLGEVSNWEDPSIKNRIEVGGILYRQDEELTFAVWDYHSDVPANSCHNRFIGIDTDALAADPSVTMLGEFHTHPASQGTVDYSSSGTCISFMPLRDAQGNRYWYPATFRAPWTYGPGPSEFDLEEWVSPSPPGWPGYAMSPDSIWRWEASSPPGGPPVVTSWALNKGSNACF